MDEQLAASLAEMRVLPGWRALVAAGGGEENLPPLLLRMGGQAERCAVEVDRLLKSEMARLPASLPSQWLGSLFEGEKSRDDGQACVGEADECVQEVVKQWETILAWRDPFALIGACYLCKSLWPSWAKVMRQDLKAINLPAAARDAIAQREMAGRKKAALLRALIEDINEDYPQTENSLAAGFETLMQVYPLRFWSALVRSNDEVAEWQCEGEEQMRVG